MKLGRINKVHFIGIGGIGMSGIAELLHHQGYTVSGSDKSITPLIERLIGMGIECFKGHSGKNIQNPDLVVYTAAISPDNPELKEALNRGIVTVRRSKMLAECMRNQFGICVSGTHGKTSTSSMAGLMLMNAGMDPSMLIGGTLRELNGSNARLGKGEFIVAEADEYDRTFLKLSPVIGIITNIEPEHLDIYRDIEDIKDAFVEFGNKVPFWSFVIACVDDENVRNIIPRLKRRVIKYGLDQKAEIRAENIEFRGVSAFYDLIADNKKLTRIELGVPGLHNVKNSLAVVALALELGIEIDRIKDSLKKFSGTDRRFEVKYNKEIMVVDDYAHHPTEVDATLNAVKGGWNRRIITVFQPHLFSRTLEFYKEFGQVFLNTDILVCLDIYPSREEPIEGVSSTLITESARKAGHENVIYLPDKSGLNQVLKELKRKDDIIIFMGAGDIVNYSENFVNNIKKDE